MNRYNRSDKPDWVPPRSIKLLDQVRNPAPESSLRTAAKRAIDDIRRGVVAVDNG